MKATGASPREGRPFEDPPAELSWLEWLSGLLLSLLAAVSWAALIALQFGRLPSGGLLALALLVGASYLIAGWRRHWLPRWPRKGSEAILAAAPLVLGLFALWRLYPAASPWVSFLDSGWYLAAGARMAREERLSFEPVVLAAPWSRLPSPRQAAEDTQPADAPAPSSGVDAASPRRPAGLPVLVSTLADGHTAGLPVLVSTLADGHKAGLPLPNDPGRGFHAVAFAVPDVGQPIAVPYHPPFFSAWIAAWLRAENQPAAARAGNAVLPWSLAYLLAAGALATAAFGSWAGILTMLLLLLGPAYAYYGPTPYAEMAAGSLALGGLWLLTRIARTDRVQVGSAAGAGLLLGLAGLAKPEGYLVLFVAVVWWWLNRRRFAPEGVALVACAAGPVSHAGLLALTVSRFYFELNGSGVLAILSRQIWRLGLGGLLVIGVAVLTMAPAEALGQRSQIWQRARRLAAILLLLGLAVLLVFGRLAPGAAPPDLVEVLAYLMTPLGLWAAATGFVLQLDSGAARRGPAPGVAAVLTPLWLMAPLVTTALSPLYGARRLVPVVLPILTALAAWLAVDATRRRPEVPLRVLTLVGLAIVLAAELVAARPLLGWREWSGSGYIADRLVARTGERDVLLFPSTLGDAEAGRLAAAVWALGDRAAGVIGSPQPDPVSLDEAIAAWRTEGRRVFLIADSADELPSLEQHELGFVDQESLVTRMLSPAPQLPARSAVHELRFEIYEALPLDESGPVNG